MKIILTQDVKGIGRKFEEKNIADGYALNFLIPKKLAVPANSQSASQVTELKKQSEAHKAQVENKLNLSLSQVVGKSINIKMKANDQGHLFASLNAEKLSQALGDIGINLEAKFLKLESPIKQIGTFTVPIHTTDGTKSSFTLEVVRS